MRKLGLIGGMSWVSTAMYYEQINKGVSRKLGGLSSAPLVIESLDFAPIARLQAEEKWDQLAKQLSASAKRLERAGAEGLILCSNTMHKVYDSIAAAVNVPILHIGDVTADKLVQDGVRRAGLIGTRFTMNESFYRDRIESHGITVATPDPGMMKEIDRIIYDELGRGIISRVSQRTLKTCLTIMGQARNQAVILGCTELVMLVDPVANVIPVYDTTALHSQAAVNWIFAGAEPAQDEQQLATANHG
ncbi:MAG TPA: amino acid racemase [Allosphingosinicella sp.]|nr:amino acid racemase [Allosphingosinicella sp.]